MDNKEVIEATQPWELDRELSREEKSVVFCIQMLNELTETGIVEGKPYIVTEQGLKSIKGFEPTDEEIEFGMLVLKSQGLLG